MNIPLKINSKLLLSGASIAAAAALVVGATFAFFSDTETSEGNVLQAGALDLKIDNTCYYNGQACTEIEIEPGVFQSYWGGVQEPGNECSCTWKLKDLGRGDVFFDLTDLKPGDWEEDTLSLHVFNNDAWACADIDITDNLDNGYSEPEDEVDGIPADNNDGTPDGDLAQELNFIFWVDDGDNVLEREEEIITQGPASDVLGDVRWALADSDNELLEEQGPLIGSNDYWIGKAFCYGELTPRPLTQGDYVSPANNNNQDDVIDSLDGGFACDGSQVGNISQTDKLTGDIVFEAIQSRNNPGFLCNPEPTPTP